MQLQLGKRMSMALSVRIPEKLFRELNTVAKITERSRSFLIQKALESYLAEQADLQIALDRLHDTANRVISIEEMRKDIEV